MSNVNLDSEALFTDDFWVRFRYHGDISEHNGLAKTRFGKISGGLG